MFAQLLPPPGGPGVARRVVPVRVRTHQETASRPALAVLLLLLLLLGALVDGGVEVRDLLLVLPRRRLHLHTADGGHRRGCGGGGGGRARRRVVRRRRDDVQEARGDQVLLPRGVGAGAVVAVAVAVGGGRDGGGAVGIKRGGGRQLRLQLRVQLRVQLMVVGLVRRGKEKEAVGTGQGYPGKDYTGICQ